MAKNLLVFLVVFIFYVNVNRRLVRPILFSDKTKDLNSENGKKRGWDCILNFHVTNGLVMSKDTTPKSKWRLSPNIAIKSKEGKFIINLPNIRLQL